MTFEVRGGCFGYAGSKNILENISISIADGDIISILGPNGVGKTTLLKCMMGLLKWKSGGSFLDGKNIAGITNREMWQKIAYVPQAKNSVFSYTAEEMILLGRNAHIGVLSQPSKADYVKAGEAMKTVGISYLRGKFCSRISGGELQMVLIARALTTEPSMLVLDEPESNLDFKNQLKILQIIKDLSKKNGISSVFNTHYPAHALKISNKSLILNNEGRTVFGPTEEIVNSENMRESFSVNVYISQLDIQNERHSLVVPLSLV